MQKGKLVYVPIELADEIRRLPSGHHDWLRVRARCTQGLDLRAVRLHFMRRMEGGIKPKSVSSRSGTNIRSLARRIGDIPFERTSHKVGRARAGQVNIED